MELIPQAQIIIGAQSQVPARKNPGDVCGCVCTVKNTGGVAFEPLIQIEVFYARGGLPDMLLSNQPEYRLGRVLAAGEEATMSGTCTLHSNIDRTGLAEGKIRLYNASTGIPPTSTGFIAEAVAFDVVEIISAVDNFVLVRDYTYPYAEGYRGNAEECTFVFSLGPEQIPGMDWLQEKIVQAFADEVAKEGAEMLKLQVYEDTTPVFTTDYKVIATATASPVPWGLIIAVVLLILFLVAITFAIIELKKFLWGEGENGGFIDMLMPMVTLMMVMMMMGMIMPMVGEG